MSEFELGETVYVLYSQGVWTVEDPVTFDLLEVEGSIMSSSSVFHPQVTSKDAWVEATFGVLPIRCRHKVDNRWSEWYESSLYSTVSRSSDYMYRTLKEVNEAFNRRCEEREEQQIKVLKNIQKHLDKQGE